MAGWHFEYTFEVEESARLLLVKVYGVWRVATAENYAKDFKEEVKPLIEKPWAKLIDLTNWKTAYPEVVTLIGQHNVWCRANNMEWAVYVISNPVSTAQLGRMIASGKYKDLSAIVKTKAEGEMFLKDKGYRTGSGAIDTPFK